MRTIETLAELRHQVAVARARGERIGFVAARSEFHDGHQALMRVARAQCEFVVVSPHAYENRRRSDTVATRVPLRNFPPAAEPSEQSRDLVLASGMDLLWTPAPHDLRERSTAASVTMRNWSLVTRRALDLPFADRLATRIVQLVGAVRPDVLYVGEKHYLEATIIRTVLDDLLIPVEVRMVPTKRAPDGLPLGTTIRSLTIHQRKAAARIVATLDEASAAVEAGERSSSRLCVRLEASLVDERQIDIEYVEIVDPVTLESIDRINDRAVLMVAIRVGAIQIVDTRILNYSPVAPTESLQLQL